MRWLVVAVCMILCVKLNVQGASLALEQEEKFAEVNDEVSELSEVKEELAEQNAEGGTQAQSGTQGQLGYQLPGGTFVNPGIGFPTLQAFPTQVGLGAPFRFAQGTYPAVLGGGFPAPRAPAQTFPQAFNPSAGFAPFGLNRAMRGVGDPFLGVNFMPSGGPFFRPFGDGGYSLVPNSLLSSIFGGGQGAQGTNSGSGTEGRASQGAAAAMDGTSEANPFVMPFFNPTVFNPYGAPGAFAAPFNPRGDGFSPFFPNTFNQQQPGAPGASTNPINPGQPAGTDAFFPFSAADIPPPSPQSNDIAIRELSGRGIPSVSAVAPEEEIPATDNGK